MTTTNALDEGRQRVLAGLMGALAIALPQVFHLVGLGSTFLPMHIPVLLAGFVVRPGLAATVGLLAPVVSMLVTGMPPAPMVPLLVAELAALGAAASLLHRRLRVPVWVALPGAIAARAAVTVMLVSLVGERLGFPPQLRSAAAVLALGLPGVGLQLVAVPAGLRLMRRRGMVRPGDA